MTRVIQYALIPFFILLLLFSLLELELSASFTGIASSFSLSISCENHGFDADFSSLTENPRNPEL